jgi:osmotically-inducible protein OsmY
LKRQERENDWLGIALATAAGLGAGVLAGIVAGEFLGDLGAERVKGAVGRLRRDTPRRPLPDPGEVETTVVEALAEHPGTADLKVGVRALGDGVVELSGTAPTAAARQAAGKVARAVHGADVVVNRILIEGDDVPRRSAEPSSAS